MVIASEVKTGIQNASWIRRMFVAGADLKSKYGAENVYDFSLGNPDLAAPDEFQESLIREAKVNAPFHHGYMPNAGFLESRKEVAKLLSRESGFKVTENNILMTVGAAGGMNVILKTLLNPGDEVIVFTPFFTEYNFYIHNHLGIKVEVDSTDDLLPNIADLKQKISQKTKAVIVNSPNNPTGKVYPEKIYREIAKIMETKAREYDINIFLIADEPYKNLIYDGAQYFSPFIFYNNTITITSFSKDLSLAGERIGYLGINPNCEHADNIFHAAGFCTRILGFVNAPALMQRVIKDVLYTRVDISQYKQRRDYLYKELKNIGYQISKPEGAFYMFPKCPIEDDIKFINILKDNLILTTPGTGFGKPGYFRISYCVPMETIINSIPKFEKAFNEIN